ncbi:protein of unknown function [Bradyrhizobium sp. ORS 285]|nr:hypothetical protein BRAO285_880011 [Bradyrhizobium sp. ORS 285]SMX61270.1 protein of unknown function [Bradyrhizobium sp. ORS 285]
MRSHEETKPTPRSLWDKHAAACKDRLPIPFVEHDRRSSHMRTWTAACGTAIRTGERLPKARQTVGGSRMAFPLDVAWTVARHYHIRLNRLMKSGAIIILLGLAALVSYSVGRQSAPDNGAATPAPTARVAQIKSVTFAAVPTESASPPVRKTETDSRVIQATTNLAPPVKTEGDRQFAPRQAKLAPPEKSEAPDAKRKAETALTAAAIVAILIKTSRDQYYATGHPCACPDDLMRNGRTCGARSAHSRPRGASPLCYPSDVTAEMIEAYRRQSTRANR